MIVEVFAKFLTGCTQKVASSNGNLKDALCQGQGGKWAWWGAAGASDWAKR